MRPLHVLVAIVMIVGGCAGPGTSTGPPTIAITRLDANGATAILGFTVEDDSGPVTVTIDWGDGSEPEVFTGAGALAASHDYAPGIHEVVVTVIATDAEANETRAGRALKLGPSASDASASPTATVGSTPTASPTPTVRPTPTTTPTPTPAPTARPTQPPPTLPPEALKQVHELELQAADFVDEVISPLNANGGAAAAGGAIDLHAQTFGFEGPITAQSRIQWLIPQDEWALLGSAPLISVILDYEYNMVLETGPNPGRAAGFDFLIHGSIAAEPNLGQATGAVLTIGAGDLLNQGDIDRTGFGTVLPVNASGPIRITLIATCSVSPGTTPFQIGEWSLCRGDLRPTIRVTLTRAAAP